MAVHLNLSNKSKLFLSLVLCCLIVLTAYTQTDMFTSDPRAGYQSSQITFLTRPAANSSEVTAQGKLLRDVYQPGFDISMPKLCSENGTNVTLLIAITSHPQHTHSRMAIRNTWGTIRRRDDVVVGFIVGRQPDPDVSRLIAEESALYGDVITSRNVDSYRNLTLKTAAIFEWARTFCRQAFYILKTDDDIYINVPLLLDFLTSVPKSRSCIYGYLAAKWAPIRNKQSKLYVSEKDFSESVFPDFTTGVAYLTTVDVTTALYEAALDMTFLPLEDVFFTGVVAQRVGVPRVDAPAIKPRLFSKRSDPCKLLKSITFHEVSVRDQFAIWTRFTDTKNKTC